MSLAESTLKWRPLYWVFHDSWQYWHINGNTVSVADHYGHMHFFIPGLDPFGDGGDAFSGEQHFDFDLHELWGPTSGDPNLSHPYTIIGEPKWYFRVRELWRRIYVHPWDYPDNEDKPAHLRRGLKYDASLLTNGPFREGRGSVPYWAAFCRTLPIEYFHDNTYDPRDRDNYVRDLAEQLLSPLAQQAYDDAIAAGETPEDAAWMAREVWWRENYELDHPAYFSSESIPERAVPSYSDRLYAWPIIEYQLVTQLDWDRVPGSDPDGDGWRMRLSIPFVNPVTGRRNSPFDDANGRCLPAGLYSGVRPDGSPLVDEVHRQHYRSVSYDEGEPISPLDQPADSSERLLTEADQTANGMHAPYADPDGRWVQQCLGGLIEAKVAVEVEHAFGGRQTLWVDTMQLVPDIPFAGRDQMAPA